MKPPVKPPYVPADVWRTCNDQQRGWCIAEHEREQRAERIKRRAAVGRARADAAKKGIKHE